jgi:hypothetical protein
MANANGTSTDQPNLDPEMDAIDKKGTLDKGLQPASSTDIGEMDGSGMESTPCQILPNCLTRNCRVLRGAVQEAAAKDRCVPDPDDVRPFPVRTLSNCTLNSRLGSSAMEFSKQTRHLSASRQ